MTLPRWDRIYFFVVSATIFAIVAYAAVLFAPLIQIEDSVTGEVTQITLLDNGQTEIVLLSLLPIALAASTLLVVPRRGVPDRGARINLWFSTFLIYVFVVLFILSNGILFIPSAILMTAAAVGSQIRRRGRRVFASAPDESKSGRGGGKRRRNKG